MAKKDKALEADALPKTDETQNTEGDTLPSDNKATADSGSETTADEADVPKSNVIEPVAVDVRLRDIYPQDSYGRCGLRFKKGETQCIAIQALEPEALIALNNDPWLELVYVTD
ncbi:transcriptional regulator [Ursidibacter arcticus]